MYGADNGGASMRFSACTAKFMRCFVLGMCVLRVCISLSALQFDRPAERICCKYSMTARGDTARPSMCQRVRSRMRKTEDTIAWCGLMCRHLRRLCHLCRNLHLRKQTKPTELALGLRLRFKFAYMLIERKPSVQLQPCA
jgi:hypothetical protein